MHPDINLVGCLDVLDEASIISLFDIRLAEDLHHVWLETENILHGLLKVLENLETNVLDGVRVTEVHQTGEGMVSPIALIKLFFNQMHEIDRDKLIRRSLGAFVGVGS